MLDQAGMVFEGEAEETEGEPSEATELDEEKLSIFKDFIESLDIEDLGKGGGGAEPKK